MAKEREKKNVGEYAFEFQQLGQQIKALGHYLSSAKTHVRWIMTK